MHYGHCYEGPDFLPFSRDTSSANVDACYGIDVEAESHAATMSR